MLLLITGADFIEHFFWNIISNTTSLLQIVFWNVNYNFWVGKGKRRFTCFFVISGEPQVPQKICSDLFTYSKSFLILLIVNSKIKILKQKQIKNFKTITTSELKFYYQIYWFINIYLNKFFLLIIKFFFSNIFCFNSWNIISFPRQPWGTVWKLFFNVVIGW